METPGLAIAATIGLSSLALALLGIVCRPQAFMEQFVRAQPPRTVSIVMMLFAAVGFWAVWHREVSPAANLTAIGMMLVITLTYVTMLRPSAPMFCLAGGIAGNLTVMAFNGLRMPVPGACDGCAAHVGTEVIPRLWWLSDCIVLDRNGTEPLSAISAGDILIAIGFALIAARVWLPRLPQREVQHHHRRAGRSGRVPIVP